MARRRRQLLVAGGVVAALTLAGCGGSVASGADHPVSVAHPAGTRPRPVHRRLPLRADAPTRPPVGPSAASPPPVVPVDATRPVLGPLGVRGNQIVDAAGRSIVLRGVMVDGLENDTLNAVSYPEVWHAAAWGATVVRIPLDDRLWVSNSCSYDPDYLAAVDQVVDWVTGLGMVALLDLHNNGVTPCDRDDSGFTARPMADYPDAVIFWYQVADRYQDNPLVAFELFNEPHDISNAVWLDGGPVTVTTASGSYTYQAAGMQQMYDAVRATGARNLVFVGGPNWASTDPPTPLQGFGIVYAEHAYTCPNHPPPCAGFADPYDPQPVLDRWLGFAADYPLLVTEVGWPDPQDGRFMTNFIREAGQLGWGWVAFAWQGDGFVSNVWALNANVSNWAPSPAGLPVWLALSGR